MIGFRNILLLFFSATVCLCIQDACLNHDTCLCQINENERIDISTILEDVFFPVLNDTVGNFTYSYLGCRDTVYPNITNESGILFQINYTIPIENGKVQTNISYPVVKTIGNASQLKFGKVDNEYVIYFNSEEKQPTIHLLCNNFKQPFLKVIDQENLKMVLSSPKVCIQTVSQGMSGGSVFLLILLIFASIYLIGGALLLYFIRGARGIELIPNIEFWKNLPGLVKDGVIFLLSGCRPNFVTTAETYDRI